MLADLVAHRFDLLGGAVDGDESLDFAGNPDGKENRVYAAFFQAWDIDAAFRIPGG